MKLGDQTGSGRSVFQTDGIVCTKPGSERQHGLFKEAEMWGFPSRRVRE